MTLERAGIQAVIEGYQQYIAGIRQMNRETVAFARGLGQQTAAASQQANKALQQTTNQAKATASGLAGSAQSVASTVKSQVGGMLGGLRSATSGLRDTVNSVLQSFVRLGVAAAIAAPLLITGASLRAATNYETQLAKIDNLTSLTREETDRLGAQVLEMTKVLPQSPSELGASAYFVLSSGISDVSEALKVVTAAAKASTAGLGPTQDIVKLVTATINAYGGANISAAQATDILFAAVRAGSGEAADFAGSLGNLLAPASAIGVKFDEVSAIMAVLSRVMPNVAEASTALRGILIQLVSPTNQAKEALKEAGFSFEEMQKSLAQEGLIPTLFKLRDAFKGNLEGLARVFPEVRGFTGFLTAIESQGAATAQVLDEMRTAGGGVDEAFKRSSETFAVQVGLLKNELNRTLIETGTAVLPTVRDAVDDLSKTLRDNQEQIKFAISAFVAFITAFVNGVSTIVNNKALFIAAMAAMGVAVVLAFGPASAAFAAAVALATLIGAINKDSAKSELPEVYKRQQAVAQKIADLGGQLPADTFAVTRSGLPPVLPEPGSAADVQRKQELASLQQQLSAASDRIAQLEDAEGKGLLGEAGNKTLADAIASAQEEVNKQIALGGGPGAASGGGGGIDDTIEKIDALADHIIDFGEAAKLGLTAFQAGAIEAFDLVDQEQQRTAESAYNYQRTLAKVATAFRESTQAANQYVLTLAREAMEKTSAAAAAVFGRPTQQQADLQTTVAEANKAVADFQAGIDPSAKLSKRAQKQQDKEQKQLEDTVRIAQARLAAEQATTDVLKAKVQAEDDSLLTAGEQASAAGELRQLTRDQSGAFRDLLATTGGPDGLIPELVAAKDAGKLLKDSMTVLNDESLRQTLIPAFDAAAYHAQLLADALEATTKSAGGGGAAIGMQSGGIVRGPKRFFVEPGETEAIVNLNNASRAREVLGSIPQHLMPGGGSSVDASTHLTVQGATLDEQEARTIALVRAEFNRRRLDTSMKRRGFNA